MRFSHQVRPLRAIFSIALFITGTTTAVTTLPESASNLVLKDVTSIDKAVPSESVAIAYDKTTTLNVPTTPEVDSTSRIALSSNGPPTPEVHSTPKAALSSTPDVPSTPKITQSSPVSQPSNVPSTPKAAEPTTLQGQTESEAALSSSLPPSTNTASAVPDVPSTLQVQPESKAALTSDPKAPTTSQAQSTSNAALNLVPSPTPSTNEALSSLLDVPSTVQVQPESGAALKPAPEVPPTLQVQSESKDALSSSLPTMHTSEAAPSLSTEGLKLRAQPDSRAALHLGTTIEPIHNLRISVSEIQQQLAVMSSRAMNKMTQRDAAAFSLPTVPTPNIRPILPSSPNATLTSSSTSSPSTTLSSAPSTPLDTLKTLISNNMPNQLLMSSSASPSSASTPSLFEDADPLTKLRVQRTTPRQFARQAGPGGLCQGEGRCVPLSYCRLLADLLDRSCLIGDRLQELTCGYGNREPLVCCPPGGFTSIYPTSPPPPTYRPTLPPPPPPTQAPQPPPPPTPLPSKCGIPQVFNWRADYRGLGSQPWVARVGFKSVESGAMQYPCCGSIISSRVILTAAHCALARTVGHKLSSVRVGEFDASQDPDCTTAFCAHKVQDVPVSHVVVHPSYERSTFLNDVALLVLRQPLNFTLTTQPICLDGGNYSPMPNGGYVGSRAKLVGWGMTAGQTDVPEVQQQLDLPVVPVEQCSRLYDQVVPITSQHMCVGGEPGRDACSGFGGAPLVMLDSSTRTRFYQIAMVSFGSKQCGAPGVPSVYTRIDKYFDWIRANMNY